MNYSSLIIWGWECNFRDAIGAEIGGFRFFDDILFLHICCDTRRLCSLDALLKCSHVPLRSVRVHRMEKRKQKPCCFYETSSI